MGDLGVMVLECEVGMQNGGATSVRRLASEESDRRDCECKRRQEISGSMRRLE